MFRFFARRLHELHKVEGDERGFTLIELLIVIIIIGILAAIAIPTFLAQRDKAAIATCKSDTRNAAEAAVLYAADNDALGNDFDGLTDIDQLAAQGFNQTTGYTTDIVTATGTTLDLETSCGTDLGTATFTTTDVDTRGEVVYNTP